MSSGDNILVAFRSPYDPKIFVRVPVPHGVTVASIREASANAVRALAVVKGQSTFGDYPLTQTGAIGLLVLTHAMMGKDIETDDSVASGMLGALSFARQTIKKLDDNVTIQKRDFDSAVQTFIDKYGPHFKRFIIERFHGLANTEYKGTPQAKRLQRMTELINEMKPTPSDSHKRKRSHSKERAVEVTQTVAKEEKRERSRSRSRSRSRERKEEKQTKERSRSRSRSKSRERKEAAAKAAAEPKEEAAEPPQKKEEEPPKKEEPAAEPPKKEEVAAEPPKKEEEVVAEPPKKEEKPVAEAEPEKPKEETKEPEPETKPTEPPAAK